MKQNNSLLVAKIAGNVLKASLILFLISSGILVYALADSDLSGNYHDLEAGQSIYTSPVYREIDEELQFFVSTGDDTADSLSENEILKLHVVIERSLSYGFDESMVVYSGDVNQLLRDITVTEPSYYRMEVSNLTDKNVEFVTADSSADVGVVVILVISLIMLSISVTAFALTIGFSIAALVLFAIFYPLYLAVKEENKPRMYYPVKQDVASDQP